MKESEINAALLISGGGSTAEAIIKACQSGEVDKISPVVVISSNPTAEGLAKAQTLGIKTAVLQPQGLTPEQFGNKLLEVLKQYGVDLISQNGWLPLTPENVVESYPGKIINQHPGPLRPGQDIDFGGLGMYGSRVTCARLIYAILTSNPQDNFTEATVHHVTPKYDQGQVIRATRLEFSNLFQGLITIVELTQNLELQQQLLETAAQIQSQLLPLEHQNVITALQYFGEHESFPTVTDQGALVPNQNITIAQKAKDLAISLH